jgi:predicted Rossmann-fold nucleotide-binding protein
VPDILDHTMDARVTPEGSLEILSQDEVSQLRSSGEGGLYELWRKCSLAVLNSGLEEDDTTRILQRYRDFAIAIVQQDRGLKLAIKNAPGTAFVDGEMIRGIREHLFAVLRDLVFIHNEVRDPHRFDLFTSSGLTNAVFHILRNARVMSPNEPPDMVVCWGGHAIGRREYDYTKKVGYELGLRGLNICTGCGAGAMKGPMKGATIGHAKQRIKNGRYLGITEPGIIAAEAPNPIVNELVIMPDMEKRLEAFIRLGHGIIVFPGGVGTAEEVLYLLGVLLNPENAEQPVPLVFTGPAESEPYFKMLDEFIGATLGQAAQSRYEIILENPRAVGRALARGIEGVRSYRVDRKDAYYFNWTLQIEHEFQRPFDATHQAMADLALHSDQPVHLLAANLRRAFAGIVGGNVREEGIRRVADHGPFQLTGERPVLAALDKVLETFVSQGRMKLSSADYQPCYRLAS